MAISKYRLSSRAERRLAQEIAYSEKRWGRKHAEQYRREILQLVKRISEAPYIYPEYPDYGEGVRRVRHKGNYVLYEVSEDHFVTVLDVPSIHQGLTH